MLADTKRDATDSQTDGKTPRDFDTQRQQENSTMQHWTGEATYPGWAVQIDGGGWGVNGGLWACGSCPALDL